MNDQYSKGFQDGERYVLQQILHSPGNASFAAKEYMAKRGWTLADIINAKIRRPA